MDIEDLGDKLVEQLVDEGWEYLALRGCEYRDDETLWFGFERLVARLRFRPA